MSIYILAVLLVIAVVALAFVWMSMQKAEQRAKTSELLLTDKDQQIRSLTQQIEGQRATEVSLREQNATLMARLEAAEQAAEHLRTERSALSETLKGEFRELASNVLKERSSDLDKRNAEALSPLREDLKRFGEQVQKAYEGEARERFSLERIIKELMQRSQQVSQDAQQLTQALRGDSKVQGDWGEMILENILEQSGLRADQEYYLQQEYRDDEGNRVRPDVVVKYPNGGFMVIDSKVSLTAYTDYVSATTDEQREAAALRHLQSIRRHISELSSKSYESTVKGSPDFVLLFVPNEPAYTLAMQQDANLWLEAYKKRIVLINGTNLIAALRMAQDMWQRDRQIRNVELIVKEATELYDKFRLYTETLLDAKKKVDNASESVTKAINQLQEGRGNIVRRLQNLKKFGVSVKKELPEEILKRVNEDEED